jgi:hypothetical protein
MWMSDKEIAALATTIIEQNKSIDKVCDKITSNGYKFNGKQVSLRKLIYQYHIIKGEDDATTDDFLADC